MRVHFDRDAHKRWLLLRAEGGTVLADLEWGLQWWAPGLAGAPTSLRPCRTGSIDAFVVTRGEPDLAHALGGGTGHVGPAPAPVVVPRDAPQSWLRRKLHQIALLEARVMRGLQPGRHQQRLLDLRPALIHQAGLRHAEHAPKLIV